MTIGHEAPSVPETELTRQQEVALEQGVLTPYMERAAENAAWPHIPPSSGQTGVGASKSVHRNKPRGTSYPQDEGRADIDFEPAPTPEELTELRKAQTPGETYTGQGLALNRRVRVELGHSAVRHATAGLPERDRIVIELARLQKNQRSLGK